VFTTMESPWSSLGGPKKQKAHDSRDRGPFD
jgi:hypothetical protein